MISVKISIPKPKQKLLIDGHYFVKFNENGDTTSWYCDKKGALNCRSIVKTCLVDGSYDIKEGPSEHTHEDLKNRKLIVTAPRRTWGAKVNTTQIPFVDQPIEALSGVNEIKFIKCQWNKPHKLYIDGFYYSHQKIKANMVAWICSHAKINCRSRTSTIITSGAHKLKRLPTAHNHDVTDVPIRLREHLKCLESEQAESQAANENRPPNIPPTEETKPTDVEVQTQTIEVKPLKEADSNVTQIPAKKNAIHNQEETETPVATTPDVPVNTQPLSDLPQRDVIEFQPPRDAEIEFAILFGLRRQMTTEQIFHECQAVHGIDAPSYETVCYYRDRFKGGYYPKNDLNASRRSMAHFDVSKIKYEDPAGLNVSVGY